MTKRMLIDASHAEETRVVVLDGTRLEEFDLEAATRKPLKGNIYLAKVVRVEPSLQAAFVEYGGNRHGFLAFSEIHPDYYQIPVADRQRLLEMQAAEAREEEEDEEEEDAAPPGNGNGADADAPPLVAPQAREVADAPPLAAPQAREVAEALSEPEPQAREVAGAMPEPGAILSETTSPADAPVPEPEAATTAHLPSAAPTEAEARPEAEPPAAPPEAPAVDAEAREPEPGASAAPAEAAAAEEPPPAEDKVAKARPNGHADDGFPSSTEAAATEGEEGEAEDAPAEEAPPPETLGGETPEEVVRERRIPPRFLRHYKIQEVIKRRQIMLVQVVKEERGTKGAALTTYISLAGRFSVLMPNSPRGGGVSRKITSATDRKRLREIIDELGLPQGMSLIVRTAGAQRPKPEIKRDCEYLLRLWDNIRERTLASTAPALIYEEADLIKRAIRDVFSRDVEEILVEGEGAYQEARDFMRMLMPQHVKKIQLSREGGLFARQQVESQLDAMHSPTVQLRSGGYIVINQTEALVAIDVNSGRATRDRHIEDTALRTNLEAADEIARQLRLRDLAGLIVIDFIDMESSKHDAMVERRLKEALKHDRARIQVGRISHFGLLEMSRQRLRPSLAETTFVTCPHCQGRGQVRSVESSALQVLRAIEDEAARRRAAEITVHVATPVALYLLNRKRERLAQIEARYGLSVLFEPDETLIGTGLRIERTRAAEPGRPPSDLPAALRMDYVPEPESAEEDTEDEEEDEEEAAARPNGEAEEGKPGEGGKRRRRRRRRRVQRPETGAPAGAAGEETHGPEEAEGEETESAEGEEQAPAAAAEPAAEPAAEAAEDTEEQPGAPAGAEAGGRRRRRRRSPRAEPAPGAEPSAPRYLGPTPADPFAGHVDDIFAAMEAAEAALEAAASQPPRAPAPASSATPATEAASAVAQAAPAESVAEESASPEPVAPEPVVPEPVAPPPAPAAAEEPAAAEPVASEPAAEPAPPEPVAPAAVTPEPVAQVEAAPAEPAAADTVPAEAAALAPATPTEESPPASAEPMQGPVVQPKVIGEAPIEAPRRTGWWRR